MAVSPDLLLKSPSVDARPKVAAAKPSSAAEPAEDGPSSFSQVYARERQDKAVERKDDEAVASRKDVAEERDADAAASSGDAEKPAVAESGNTLPADEEDELAAPDVELDPMLLLGLTGQLPVPDAAAAAQPQMLGLMAGLIQPPAQTPVDGADMPLADDSLATLDVTVESAPLPLQATPAGEQSEPLAAAVDPVVEESFSSLLSSAGEAQEKSDFELAIAELSDEQGLEAPQESRQPTADTAVGRANPLSQAIAQQVQQSAKVPLVPGQPVQMQQGGWSEAVVDRVMWLSSQNLKSAEIQLDPAELGRMEVRIEMNRDQTQITFLSPHAGVRDALEGQMQRLREMFDQQGMSMNVSVSDQSLARGWQGRGDGGAGRGGAAVAGVAGEDEQLQGVSEIASTRAGANRGLVDYYA